jgi:di/tricarboxylate transporter
MSTEIILTFAVLGVTIFLFVSEWLRVDVVALCVMLALPWLGLVEPHEALAGLSSNAVFSIIAVMILGRGVDRSGIMAKVTRPILRVAGSSERRLVSLVSAAVGTISAFMQNIGAAALFLPALLRIAKRTGLPESRLLMPVGFAAILGGTLTMVASGPLIILNDILRQGGQSPFGLFAVTPVGLTLLFAGILYFIILGPVVLPSRKDRGNEPSAQQELIDTWDLASKVTTGTVPDQSALVGKTVEEAGLWATYGVNLLLLREGGDVQPAPWRQTHFAAGQELVLLGADDQVARFAADYGVELNPETPEWFESFMGKGGFAELVVLPRSPLAGQCLRDFGLRKDVYGRAHRVAHGCRTPARRFLRHAPVRRRRDRGARQLGTPTENFPGSELRRTHPDRRRRNGSVQGRHRSPLLCRRRRPRDRRLPPLN